MRSTRKCFPPTSTTSNIGVPKTYLRDIQFAPLCHMSYAIKSTERHRRRMIIFWDRSLFNTFFALPFWDHSISNMLFYSYFIHCLMKQRVLICLMAMELETLWSYVVPSDLRAIPKYKAQIRPYYFGENQIPLFMA